MVDQNIIYLVTIDGSEITEHNRNISGSEVFNTADIELASGNLKRYIKKNKKIFTLSFTYLPNLATYTVDGRVGRNYLKQMAEKRGAIEITVAESPSLITQTIEAYVTSYSETLIRREINNRLEFYDVTISFEEA